MNWVARVLLVIGMTLSGARLATAQEALTGSLNIHDPSTMIKHGDRYYIFATGNNISSKSSADKINWTNGPTVFSSPPAWTTAAVPLFTGTFWAPDIIYLNGQYHLYYSVSSFGSQTSAIGLVTNPTLDPNDPNYLWTDQGAVIQSGPSVNYNAIDPGVFLANDGRFWMTFGSFWTGIKMIELDPATGKRISPASTVYALASHPPDPNPIEAPYLIQRSNYFYLFVNWDKCCSGLNSTYNIRVGRSTNVAGPYLDRNGVNMASGGGTLLLESSGRFLGPGHAGIMVEGETNWFTYHYYDGTTGMGTSRLAMTRLFWGADDWPQITNEWSAFYTFEADAREHRGVYNGTLLSGAAVMDETNRSRVLNLNGTSQSVTLPLSVANGNTFATWVKWNGGNAGQRIFDFGSNTVRYFYLTPSNASNGRMRFGIRALGGNEVVVDAPSPLAVGAWSHVAVTLDGSRGRLYLNGNLVASNNIVARPALIMARSNYLGDSQFTSDPLFNGRIDSFRVYGRPLRDAEIQQLAEAHPSLAHRYSFGGNPSDSIGEAHGRLNGAAAITNNALVLNGSVGTYAKLPGGLVSGCAAVSVEFWATFGVNGDWSRVFDFGNTNNGSGQQFLFFSPHTGSGSHRLTISTSIPVDLDVPGTLDGRTVHVVCIVDPPNGYSAIYTNGVLERAVSTLLPPLSGVSTAMSFLGRSLFNSDAWLNAALDEFRVYDGRLTADEIAANFAAGPDALALPVTLTASGSPGGIILRWPSYAVGYALESSPALGPAATWSPVSQTPVIQSSFFQLPVSTTNGAQFFRLQR